MTKENLVTVPVGTTLEDARIILHTHRVEKLLVVDDSYTLKGLITVKDIQKKLKYPERGQGLTRATARGRGHWRNGRFPGTRAGVGSQKGGCAGRRHGARSQPARHGCVKTLKKAMPELEVLAGNVATYRRRARFDRAWRGWIKGRHRSRLDLHNARGDRRGFRRLPPSRPVAARPGKGVSR